MKMKIKMEQGMDVPDHWKQGNAKYEEARKDHALGQMDVEATKPMRGRRTRRTVLSTMNSGASALNYFRSDEHFNSIGSKIMRPDCQQEERVKDDAAYIADR